MSKAHAFLVVTAFVLTVIVAMTISSGTMTAQVHIQNNLNVNSPLNLNQDLGAWLRHLMSHVCIRRPSNIVIGWCLTNDNDNANDNANENANQNANENSNQNTNEPTNENANTNQPTNGNENTNTNAPANGNSNANSNTNTPQGQSSSGILISEVFATTPNSAEWIEIYNGSGVALDFNGWMIGDTSTFDTLPATGLVPPQGLLLILATSSPTFLEPLPQGIVKVLLDSLLTNGGLNNSGDSVVLKNDAGAIVDAMSYGSASDPVFTPTATTSPAGHSYFRISPTVDTESAADWDHHAPNPGIAP